MSLVEALDKGCMPLLGTARFLFCGSRFLRVRFFGLPRSWPRLLRVRPFAFLLRTRCCPCSPSPKLITFQLFKASCAAYNEWHVRGKQETAENPGAW